MAFALAVRFQLVMVQIYKDATHDAPSLLEHHRVTHFVVMWRLKVSRGQLVVFGLQKQVILNVKEKKFSVTVGACRRWRIPLIAAAL